MQQVRLIKYQDGKIVTDKEGVLAGGRSILEGTRKTQGKSEVTVRYQ